MTATIHSLAAYREHKTCRPDPGALAPRTPPARAASGSVAAAVPLRCVRCRYCPVVKPGLCIGCAHEAEQALFEMRARQRRAGERCAHALCGAPISPHKRVAFNPDTGAVYCGAACWYASEVTE